MRVHVERVTFQMPRKKTGIERNASKKNIDTVCLYKKKKERRVGGPIIDLPLRHFQKCAFTYLYDGAAQQATLSWCQTPSLLNRPITTQLSAPAPIIILLATNTAQLPAETPTPGLPQAVKTQAREKLAGSSDGSDQTAINQQRKHLSMRRMLTASQHLWL